MWRYGPFFASMKRWKLDALNLILTSDLYNHMGEYFSYDTLDIS